MNFKQAAITFLSISLSSQVKSQIFKFPRNITCSKSKTIFYCENANFKKNIIISIPHSQLEKHTFKQGISIFISTEGRFLIINRKHRCLDKTYSTCEGKTRVCGQKKQAYRTSDSAHNNTAFYKTHVNFVKKYNSKVIQFHETLSKNISFIISTGVKILENKEHISNSVVAYINKSLKFEKKAVSCQNKYKKLCGSTNTLGRFLNGSRNSCQKEAIKNSEKFLHIEQNYRIFEKKEAIVNQLFTNIIKTYYN